MIHQKFNSLLKTKWLGQNLCYEECVDSTNKVAKQLGVKNAPNGLVVLAEEQNAGKGRLGRGWFSPKGKGLWFSVLFRPKFVPEEAPKCTLMAAAAVAKAINKICGVDAKIKWPNDILLNNKKLVGILSEMNAEYGKLNFVVIGIGINTNVDKSDFPDDVKDIAISLHTEATKEFGRELLLAEILQELEIKIEQAEKEGFENIFQEWRQMTCTLNKDVKVIAQDETYFGRAIDIDAGGMLIVERKDGKRVKVVAGDVSIRSVN